MVFGKGRVISDIAITINQNIIERVYETKFLDIIIDDELSWKAHIQLVKSKLAQTIPVYDLNEHCLEMVCISNVSYHNKSM